MKFKRSFIKTRFLALLFSLVFLSGCAGSSVADQDIKKSLEEAEKPKINWGVKYDTNLFGMYNITDQEVQGFDIDIAKALTDVITDGRGEANFIEVTSKTRIPLLKNGNIDAIIATMTISEERKKEVDFSDVYYDAGQDLLVPDGSEINSLDDLTADHTVLAVKGSTSAKNIRELAPKAEVLELENYSECFTALKAGQGDCMTTDNAILLGIMDKNPGYHITGKVFTEEPYGIAVNKDKQEAFLKEVNDALATIKANGTYDEIYNKWFSHLVGKLEEGDKK
ncbi:MAG: transporter substrate-binding domain-containing protein [Finegoldia sp.]|nr:transporter substrate-binding domain-containing protein [Finegoldia sp.]